MEVFIHHFPFGIFERLCIHTLLSISLMAEPSKKPHFTLEMKDVLTLDKVYAVFCISSTSLGSKKLFEEFLAISLKSKG